MKVTTFLLIAMYFLFNPSGTTAQIKSNWLVDSLAAEIREKHAIPAIAVGIIKSDTCYYGIQGTTKVKGTKEVVLKSKFHLGSNSKAITSFIAMKMVKEEKLHFHTKFIDMFPELKDSIRKEYQLLTLEELLSHRAKVQPYTSGLDFEKLPQFEGNVSERRYAFSKYVLKEKSVQKGIYSNAGYVIASLMLEKASSQTFEQLVKDYLRNLGLDCYFGFPNKESELNPWGHWKENEELIPLEESHAYKLEDYMLAAGDVSIDIVDYSRFIQIHLQGLHGRSNYLEKKDFKTLHFGLRGLSYGWGNKMNILQKVSFHDGSAGTYYCHTYMIPKKDLAIIIMTNSAEPKQIQGIYQLRKQLVRKRKRIL